MGVVYLAEQLALKRKVALKLLASDLAEDASFRERFLRESRSWPHRSTIRTSSRSTTRGEATGVLYLTMRYVEGSDLGELLDRENRLAPERALELLEPVAESER